jgi:flagellar L-ring protein precursor FlgH
MHESEADSSVTFLFLSTRLATGFAVLALAVSAAAASKSKTHKDAAPSPLDKYITDAAHRKTSDDSSPGSLWSPAARFSDLGADPRATRVDDIVTIVVNENTSAVSTGVTKTSRASGASASISSLGGVTKATGALNNLLNTSGNQTLDGEGSTSRSSTLTSILAARVIGVMPNGNLIVEGSKAVGINSENQIVSVRGVVRPVDIASDDSVSANNLAEVEVKVNGKGVVNDVARRPNFLYRLLLGILPF